MTGYERNYDFADLINCASGLNKLASMEYGEEKVVMGRGHAKQQTIGGKLHPLSADENEPDLVDFTGPRTDDEFIAALKEGLQEAQNLLILLNMAPHTGIRNQVWWKTPWVSEMELGLFQRGSEVAPDPMDNEEQEDGVDDLTLLGNETRHVMSEVLQQISSEDQEVKKYDSMVVYDGHAIYKATLVSQLVGNPTLSKDRLTRIKQSIFFNGVKQKPRVDGVPVCILDIGSDCAVLFDTERTGRISRSRRRPVSTLSKDV
ncbi:hypothetical protein R1sor_017464 [Riccia sorocarpa]|uniref:Uncharacterized protein n=1 Tax=Riccia sorocarpa TaxID=122646 RepID=A0ABD3I9Q4_9MARC